MNENEFFNEMFKPYTKNTDVVGDQDSPNVYNSVNVPKKIDYSFLHNDIFNLLIQLESDKYSVSKTIECLCLANQFLKKYNWNFLPDDPSKTGQLFIKHVLLNFSDEEIYSLKKNIDKLELINYECEKKIKFNTICSIKNFLLDDNNINKKYDYLMFRKVKGNGNSFFRVVIFAFLENLIFKKDLVFLKNFIVDFKMKLQNEKLIKMAHENNINLNQTFKCLIMIYFSMTSKSRDPILKSYAVLIKLFNNFEDFDKGLIAYYRILLYIYIDQNRDKTLLEDFPIFIGNLLPSEFIHNQKYDYDKFFDNYLLKFNQLPERIVIYLTPFILGFNIEILYLNSISEINTIHCKKSLLNAGNYNSEDNLITLLYKQTHYDLVYRSEYIKKYKNYVLIDYINIKPKFSCVICKEDDKSILERFKKLGRKELFICAKCMIKEIKFSFRNLILYFMQKQKRFYLSRNEETIQHFLDCDILFGNIIEINIKEAIKRVEKIFEHFNFETLVKNIKNSICIVCNKTIKDKNNFKITLPCNCSICSKECLKEFYDYMKNSVNSKENMFCFCGENYEFWEVYKFLEITNYYQIDSQELINYYIETNSNKCFICLKKFYDVIKCEILDKKLLINSKITHYFCKECLRQIKNKDFFKCNFCLAEHRIHLILGDM